MRGIKNVFVVGRKNPDLDSVASTIALAELKNTIDKENTYIATVCGGVDEPTQKFLGYFNIPFPNYMKDLRLRVEDVMTSSNVVTVNKNDSVTEIFKLMLKEDLMVVPVVENNGSFVGYFGMIDIAKKSISSVMPDIFRKIKTSVKIIRNAVDGETIVPCQKEEETFIATLIMGVMDEEGLLNVIERIEPENAVMVVGNRKDLQKAAIDVGIRCLVLSHGYRLDDELIKKAEENCVSVIVSEYDAFATVGLIEWSTPVESICEKSSITVKPTDLVNDIKEKVYKSSNRALAVTDNQNRVKGIITRTDIIKFNKRNVILVDHSSTANAPEGIFECNVLEIIDHHRLGDIQTGFKTRYRIEPWGATASIIADEFRISGTKPSKTAMLLLLGGILENTNFLNDEKTTEHDIDAAKWLCSVWDVDFNDMVEDIKNAINS